MCVNGDEQVTANRRASFSRYTVSGLNLKVHITTVYVQLIRTRLPKH